MVSGESGSGKTVAAQKVLYYLTTRHQLLAEGSAGQDEGAANSAAERVRVGIHHSSYLLEAYAHAKTTRNLNASRYGRAFTLQMSKASGGIVCGASLSAYNLERSRVTNLHDPERNFHIFYSLLHSNEEGVLLSTAPPGALQ